MERRAFLFAFALGALAAPTSASSQPAEKVRRIGHLTSGSPATSVDWIEVFRQRLRELGWVEGHNLFIDRRAAEGRFDRLPDLAAELVALEPDLIVASPTPAAIAARKATDRIPIVMINVGDPVGLGLVASLARPGGNVTGLAYSVGLETIGKGVDLLREAVPAVRRMAVLTNPANPAQPIVVRDLKGAASSLGVQFQFLEASGPDEFERAFAAMAEQRAGAIVVVPDAVSVAHRERIAGLAAGHKLPSIYGLRENVEAGGLMSYGPNFSDQFRHAATFVDQILRGAKPAELPIKQPTQFELVINLRTARALGIDIPGSLLARADEVIE